MKTKNAKKSIFSIFAVTATLFVSAQSTFNFNKRWLISGTEKKQGAVYRFSTVKTDVDAIVTVAKLTRSASIDSFEFSSPGIASALQPEISIAPHCWGYVLFNIQFVKAGTSIPVALSDIPAKGNNYGSNYSNVKLDVLSSSASSFKVRIYTVNPHAYTLNIKADVFLQTFANENNAKSETASASFANAANGY